MKQSWHVRRFLLVAADVRHEVDLLEAVQDNVAADELEHIFELVYFDSVHAVIYDSVRSGFFMTVHSVPPATTWSRSGTAVLQANRHFVRDTNLSATQRLSVSAHVMVIQSNHEVEVVCWFLEQALLCSSRFVSVLLAYPEHLERIPVSGPAIICELHQ